MLKGQYFGYIGLNKILKVISPVSFYFLMWLLENLNYTHGSHYISIELHWNGELAVLPEASF